MILGIDEAGRGPVLGPLVVAGVWATPSQINQLVALGVRDSKAFGSGRAGQRRRAALAEKVRQLAHVATIVAPAEQVDRWTSRRSLNRLEQCMAQRLIIRGPETASIVADGRSLFAPLQRHYPQLVAVDRADADHPTVAAASIVAKDLRDRALLELVSRGGAIPDHLPGGGYPNGATARFLHAFVAQHGKLPDGVRHSWAWSVLRELQHALDTPAHALDIP